MSNRNTENCGVWRVDGNRMVNMVTGEEKVDSNPPTCYTTDKVETENDLNDLAILWDKLVTVLKGDNTP